MAKAVGRGGLHSGKGLSQGAVLADLLYRVRALLQRRRLEEDLETELQFHLDKLTEKHCGTGVAPSEARRRARIELGGLARIREECRQAWGVSWIDALFRDFAYALARLKRYPRSAAVIGCSLALGIAANTLMFSVFNAASNPNHFTRIHELVRIFESDRRALRGPASVPSFRDMKHRQQSLAAIAAYRSRVFSISDGLPNPELVDGTVVSASLFRTLGASPILGRTFSEREFSLGAPGRVIVSHGFWHSRLSSRDDVLSRSLTINGRPHDIVGVMPRRFRFPFSSDVWLPWDGELQENGLQSRNLQVIGRLSAIATPEVAEAELSEIVSELEPDREVVVMPLLDSLTGGGRMRTIIALLLATAGFLLLVVCLNVASIRSADALSRQRETATYLALGASRGEVIQRFLTESIAVALVGGTVGLMGAHLAIRYMTARFQADIPYWMEIRLDGASLLYSFGLSVIVGVISGIQPAFQSSRTPLRALRVGISGSRRTASLLKLFVLVQVAAATVLLVGTKTAIDGLDRLQQRDLGFADYDVLAVSVPLLSDRYASRESKGRAVTQLLERVRSLASVNRVAAIDPMPMKDNWNTTLVRAPGGSSGASETGQVWVADYRCTPNYFSVLGIRLLAGDLFHEAGGSASRNEAVINRKLARLLFDGDPQAAVGESIKVEGQSYVVVGVVEDSHHDPRASDSPRALYRQISALPPNRISLLLDSQLASEPLRRPLQAAIRQFDPTLAVSSVQSVDSLLAASISISRASTHTLALVSLTALIMALMGIYGMAATVVARQGRELAIRRALGSSRVAALFLVLRQTSTLTAIGITVGTALSVPMIDLLRSAFFGIAQYPIATYFLAWSSIGGTSLLAAAFAAQRTLRRQPFEILSS